jgi:hypothetical protein
MRRRLYFILPDLESARRAADDLLLARIDDSMVGSSVPNSRLKQFQRDIEAGKVLMMVDVPYGRVDSVRQVVTAGHPEVVQAGQVRPYLVFP